MTVKTIEVTNQTTGYGYFQVVDGGGRHTVYQCSHHWADGMKQKKNIGSTKTLPDAIALIKSYSGGDVLKFW